MTGMPQQRHLLFDKEDKGVYHAPTWDEILYRRQYTSVVRFDPNRRNSTQYFTIGILPLVYLQVFMVYERVISQKISVEHTI